MLRGLKCALLPSGRYLESHPDPDEDPAEDGGMALEQAVEETRLLRLRAILMTALAAALELVPTALNASAGVEVQRPITAQPVAARRSSSAESWPTTFSLSMVLPALYALFGRRRRTGYCDFLTSSAQWHLAAVFTAIACPQLSITTGRGRLQSRRYSHPRGQLSSRVSPCPRLPLPSLLGS